MNKQIICLALLFIAVSADSGLDCTGVVFCASQKGLNGNSNCVYNHQLWQAAYYQNKAVTPEGSQPDNSDSNGWNQLGDCAAGTETGLIVVPFVPSTYINCSGIHRCGNGNNFLAGEPCVHNAGQWNAVWYQAGVPEGVDPQNADSNGWIWSNLCIAGTDDGGNQQAPVAPTFVVTPSAQSGCSISPSSAQTVNQWDDASFTAKGSYSSSQNCSVVGLSVDGSPASLTGNGFTFWAVNAAHSIQVLCNCQAPSTAHGQAGNVCPTEQYNSSQVYDDANYLGKQVQYNGYAYTYVYWNQGVAPSKQSGWKKAFSCNPEADSCADSFDPEAAYYVGDHVVFQGENYEAKWSTQPGDAPDASNQWGSWKHKGSCRRPAL